MGKQGCPWAISGKHVRALSSMGEFWQVWVSSGKYGWVMSSMGKFCHAWASSVKHARVLATMGEFWLAWVSMGKYRCFSPGLSAKNRKNLAESQTNLDFKLDSLIFQVTWPFSHHTWSLASGQAWAIMGKKGAGLVSHQLSAKRWMWTFISWEDEGHYFL